MLVYKLGALLLTLTVGSIAARVPAVSTLSVRQLYGRQKALLARLQQQTVTCSGAGYVGCCNATSTDNCSVPKTDSNPPLCYCDKTCHTYGDCCDEIVTNGCPAHGMCADLPSVPNGAVVYNDSTMEQKPVKTVATYSCNWGFTLYNGTTIRTCQDSGWTGSAPKCEEVCPNLLPLIHGTIVYTDNSKSIRTVAIYSCNQGYSLFGVDKRVCRGSQGWSGVAPRCEVVSCMIQYPDTGGCPPNRHSPLLGSDGNPKRCSCDLSCFSSTNDDTCCEDIGCAPSTCAQANIPQGCCSWGSQGCYVPGGECYCDSECKAADDCCADVPPTPTCTAVRQSRVRGQSVRTMPFGRAQLAKGGRTQVSMEDHNLARELKSMSQEAVRSKHRWEVMADELEQIQLERN